MILKSEPDALKSFTNANNVIQNDFPIQYDYWKSYLCLPMCVRTQRLARPSIFGFEGVHFISKFLSIFLFPYNNKIGQKFNNIKCGFSLQYYDVQKLWMACIHVTSENLGSPPNIPL